MALKDFDTRNLKFIDGGAFAEQVDMHTDLQVRDCISRPHDNRPRTITIEYTLVPLPGSNGRLKTIAAELKVKSKSPYHKSDAIQLGIDPDGKAVFNEHSMGNVDQASFLPDGEDD